VSFLSPIVKKVLLEFRADKTTYSYQSSKEKSYDRAVEDDDE